MALAIGTLTTKNYLASARVLANSLRQYHPDIPIFVLLTDRADGYFEAETESFHLLQMEQIGIPDLPHYLFHYPQRQAAIGAKPYLMRYLLDQGYDRVIFLDADILALGDLTPLFAPLDRHPIALSPHFLTPPRGATRLARELNVLQAGTMNSGCVGVADTPVGRAFLAWWQDRLYDHCRYDIPQGLHNDQRWLDLAPGFFDGVHIWRQPGLNVAYWNLAEREVRLTPTGLAVNGVPIGLFHFSGFSPDQPQLASKFAPQLTLDSMAPLAALFKQYAALLAAAGYHTTKTWPYAYDRFENGVPIPTIVRQVYAAQPDAVARWGDPFRTTPPDSFYHWLTQSVDTPPSLTLTISNLWYGVYQQRPDVQLVYPKPLSADRAGFVAWVREYGEHSLL